MNKLNFSFPISRYCECKIIFSSVYNFGCHYFSPRRNQTHNSDSIKFIPVLINSQLIKNEAQIFRNVSKIALVHFSNYQPMNNVYLFKEKHVSII